MSGHPAQNLSQIRITAALPTDAGRIFQLHPIAARSGWSESGIRSFLAMPDACSALAWTDEGPAGYYLCRSIPPEWELLLIAVAGGWRQLGIGTQLLSHLLGEAERRACRNCFLEVRASNHEAISFYLHRGFSRSGTRKGYYRDPVEDALVMTRGL